MLERRRERILVGAVGALLGLLALDRLVVRPLWGYFAGIDERMAALRAEIADGRAVLGRHAEAVERLDRLRARAGGTDEALQNRFRQHVEDRVDPAAEVRRFQALPPRPVAPGGAWRRVPFELELTGRLGPVGATLYGLDASEGLLRIEDLRMENPSIDAPTLRVRMTVSTLAWSPEGS
jgi:hypothetical protein